MKFLADMLDFPFRGETGEIVIQASQRCAGYGDSAKKELAVQRAAKGHGTDWEE